ncbi:hypothetical protein GCM10017786_26960 [Amycolatopsis deserti]|uniref:HTH luxR-type domain-containing protein n=1 Tax=Amycolatopsis deserti TaxID=185696 RepID=A0ABQ3IVQ4_9PSEU|nr:LuxR C-terminal-related transcriptional regulator [Amycolatopsis deserti]GHE92858.1 hypothetical protein GCM10017786_26960 [Amycolatopsis deserti]
MTATLDQPLRAAHLTAEELAVLALLADGLPVDAVARRLNLSKRTVQRRIRRICDRLDVHAPIQAVVWAARHKLI